ncbi:FAD-dependent oxidoreductase [Streptomyces shenzhenensis]|uniref:FAD-dependent oxidoreductase n=1 Tax=Streptomyces shenzhenensis TaxID=943815 RepID=UPI001F2C407F|nr:FAD-binding protein [Streptomyces shenzhenensis]
MAENAKNAKNAKNAEDVVVDVVVAGAGACGLVAGLRASENPDLVVAVLEKSTRDGCNAQVSSGSLAAGGTRFQAAAGIDDSPARHAADILAENGDDRHRPLVEALTAAAPHYVHWIAADLGYPLEVGTDMTRHGISVPRLHTDPQRRGGGPLVSHLRGILAARPNVALLDETPVTGLRVDGSGPQARVVGVTARQNGTALTVAARTTVLATDGFAGNRALMREFCAGLGDPFHGGVSTATGDAVAWLRGLGAEFRNMGACLRHGQVTMHGTRVNPNLPWLGAVLVNTRGERFVDEQAHGYSGLAPHVAAQPNERALMIWDDEADLVAAHSEMMRESAKAGALGSAADLVSLARDVRMDPLLLERALEPIDGRRRLVAPFHYAWLTHGVLTTQGGAAIDTHGRVLRKDGSAVAGLRAGGGTAVGLAGPDSAGYSSGNGLLAAMGMGWIVGNDLAAGTGGGLPR